MEQKDEKMILFDGRLSVRLTGFFQPMADERRDMMFPYEKRPQLILEEKGASRYCTYSLMKEQSLTENQVNHVIHSIAYAVAGLYPACRPKGPKLERRGNVTCGWFSFLTKAREGSLYHVMAVCPVDGCMMLATFGCLLDDETGKAGIMHMLGSLKIPGKRPAEAGVCGLNRKRDGETG